MLLKGAYCVGEHFVDPQCSHLNIYVMSGSRGVQLRQLFSFVFVIVVNFCVFFY